MARLVAIRVPKVTIAKVRLPKVHFPKAKTVTVAPIVRRPHGAFSRR